MLVMFEVIEDIGRAKESLRESQETSALLKTDSLGWRESTVYISRICWDIFVFVLFYFFCVEEKEDQKAMGGKNCYDRAAGILRIESREASTNKCTGK